MIRATRIFFCLQETKLQAGQIQLELPGYHQFWNYAQKKGYSGTAIFAREAPLSVRYGLGVEALDTEGRLITPRISRLLHYHLLHPQRPAGAGPD